MTRTYSSIDSSERISHFNPSQNNPHPVQEKKVNASPQLENIKERLSRVMEAVPQDLRPPALRNVSNVRNVIDTGKLFVVLDKDEYAKYGRRIMREIGQQIHFDESFYIDQRTGQTVVCHSISGEDAYHMFLGVATGFAALQVEKIDHPSMRSIAIATGIPVDQQEIIWGIFSNLGITLTDVRYVTGGVIRYEKDGRFEQLNIGSGWFVHELFQTSYCAYLSFLEYCMENGLDRHNHNDALQRYQSSNQFKKLAITEGIHLFNVVEYALTKKDGFEEVLREFKQVINSRTEAEMSGVSELLTVNAGVYSEFASKMRIGDFLNAAMSEYIDLVPAQAIFYISAYNESNLWQLLEFLRRAVQSVSGSPQQSKIFGNQPIGIGSSDIMPNKSENGNPRILMNIIVNITEEQLVLSQPVVLEEIDQLMLKAVGS